MLFFNQLFLVLCITVALGGLFSVLNGHCPLEQFELLPSVVGGERLLQMLLDIHPHTWSLLLLLLLLLLPPVPP